MLDVALALRPPTFGALKSSVFERYPFRPYTHRLYRSKARAIHAWRQREILDLLQANPVALRGGRVLELGCSDLFSLALWCEAGLAPAEYVGVDVFWGGARSFAERNARLLEAWNGTRIALRHQAAGVELEEAAFDTVIALETLEHVPDEDTVLAGLQRALRPGGRLLLSVPVEFGPLFGVKEVARTVLKRRTRYTPGEYVNALLGRTERVRRAGHKGYDFRRTRRRLRRFDFVPVCERLYPFTRAALAYGYIGLWAKPAGTA